MTSSQRSLGIYVHIPFCRERCAYCDFSIVVDATADRQAYVDRVLEDLRQASTNWSDRPLETLYFGGGTPSSVDPSLLRQITSEVREAFSVSSPQEISLEANPEDVTHERLESWLESGVSRITIGIQSLTSEGLESIGRPGDLATCHTALKRARQSGVASLGVDFIYGRPGQTASAWQDELLAVCELDVDHVSAYALEVDGATPLVRSIESGRTLEPSLDDQADMFEQTARTLTRAGLMQYEISNFARSGHESRHNTRYWTDQDYLGLGQSASSYVDGERWTQPRGIKPYLERRQPEIDRYDANKRCGEALIFGLRRLEGVDLSTLARRYGEQPIRRRRGALDKGVRDGLLVEDQGRVRLTANGRLLAHEIFEPLL